MERLERLNLDNTNDPNMENQFNPMANQQQTGLSLQAQNQRMGKDTAFKMGGG